MEEQSRSSTTEVANSSGFIAGEEEQHASAESVFESGEFVAALPTIVDEGFDSPEWLFQVVEEGLPVLLVAGANPEIRSRLGRNLHRFFPELHQAIDSLPADSVLDARVICRDRPDAAHARISMTDHEIAAASLRYPCLAVAHDALVIAGEDFRARTTAVRRDALAATLSGPRREIELATVAENHGMDIVQLALSSNTSGVLAKRKGTYYPGRLTRSWRFIPCDGCQEFVAGGYQRAGQELIILAGAFDGSRFEFVRSIRVPVSQRATVLRRLQPLTRRNHPFHENPAWKLGRFWTSPQLVVQTERGRFVRLRPDLCPTDVLLHREAAAGTPNMRRSKGESLRLQRRLGFPQP